MLSCEDRDGLPENVMPSLKYPLLPNLNCPLSKARRKYNFFALLEKSVNRISPGSQLGGLFLVVILRWPLGNEIGRFLNLGSLSEYPLGGIFQGT